MFFIPVVYRFLTILHEYRSFLQDLGSIFSKDYSFCNPFRESLCMKYPLTFCIGESSGFGSFYNILKTWICIFLDDIMLRRKLQSSGCSLVDNMSFLPGCFFRNYYLLSWAIDFFCWSVGIFYFSCLRLSVSPRPQNSCSVQAHKMFAHISLYFTSFLVFLFCFSQTFITCWNFLL